MSEQARGLHAAVWAAAEGVATADQLAVLDADPTAAWRALDELRADTEEQLDAVQRLSGPERDQVVADVEAELGRLTTLEARWSPIESVDATESSESAARPIPASEPLGVRL